VRDVLMKEFVFQSYENKDEGEMRKRREYRSEMAAAFFILLSIFFFFTW